MRAPVPPLDLMDRVGSVSGYDDPAAAFDQLGERAFTSIRAALPHDWSWDGKTVLDFGCGAGRVLRHLLEAAPGAEVWGCDIDEPSVAWVRSHLCPPMAGVVENGAEPPVALPDGRFDLVYAVSVFTHLSFGWERWLLEVHRLLAEGGLLLATFIGEGASHWIVDEPWDAERVGMSVSSEGQSWDLGGPMVRHSPWWIQEHWGRLFDVVAITPSGFGQPDPGEGHGIALLRKVGAAVPAEALVAPALDDRREVLSLAAEVARRTREVGQLHTRLPSPAPVPDPPPHPTDEELEATRRVLAGVEAELVDARRRIADLEASTSWRLTAPLRRLSERIRPPSPSGGPPPAAVAAPRGGGLFHPPGDRTAPTASAFGGLWFDRSDADELRRAALDAGTIDPDEAEALRSFAEEGFAIVRGAIEPELARRLALEIDAAMDGDERFLVTVNGYRGAAATAIEPWMRDRSEVKLLDAYAHLATAREVLLHPRVTRFLTLAFNGEAPSLFQSLSFLRGSEQWLHQDSAYVRVDRPMELVACWIALEDVQAGAGELLYAPGSHRLPEQLFGDGHKSWLPERDGREGHARWAEALPTRVVDAGYRVERFLPSAGDVLFWHADLVHGGSPIDDPAKHRRSIVGHYCPVSALPDYRNRLPVARTPHGDASYSSDHYG